MYQKIEDFLYKLLTFVKFIYRTFRRENPVDYITGNTVIDSKTTTLYILANGPSLKNSIDSIKESGGSSVNDIMMMNFSANTGDFYILRPKYYCISDYTFYWFSDYAREKVELMFNNLNSKVDWSLNIYIPYRWYKDKVYLKRFTNPYLNIVPFHTLAYQGFERFRFPLMVRNIGGADFGTVLQNAINIGIILGYKEIQLFGADHTFFDGLTVNEENQVCRVISHYYEDSDVSEPIYHYFDGGKKTPYTMSFLMAEYARLFAGHDLMRRYADWAGVRIVNMTPGSMIDSYERG